jgi:hypothetical protein
MAGAAAGAGLTTARLGLPAASRCVCRHKGEHVHEKVTGYVCVRWVVQHGVGAKRRAQVGAVRHGSRGRAARRRG